MKRILPLVLVMLGVLILLGAAGWTYFESLVNNPAPVTLPDQIAGLPLTGQMIGAQAAENFTVLHDKEFPITSGAVGVYGASQATLWVAGTPLNFMAADMVSSMREKIAEGKSPFTPTGEIPRGERTIYMLDGMGQKHFYFQSGSLVIWLAVDPPLAESALQDILLAYP